MLAVITKRNDDGTYDEVGMRNRRITGEYKSLATMLRGHGRPQTPGTYRYELYPSRETFYRDSPMETVTVEWDGTWPARVIS